MVTSTASRSNTSTGSSTASRSSTSTGSSSATGSSTATGSPRFLDAAAALLAAAAAFEPQAYSGPQCARVAKLAARVEKAASAVRVLSAARAADTGAHKDDGIADPASWLARQAGTTGKEARQSLALAQNLSAHEKTKDALLTGLVSLEQAQEIVRAEEAAPGQEQELLELAENADLGDLREEARKRRLSSLRPEDLHQAQHAARSLRHWRDDLGMVRIEAALPPETGLPLVTRIEREALRLRAEAKRHGDPEGFCAYAADALFSLVSAAAPRSGRSPARTDLVVVCDLYAWRRGHVHEGEVCHIVGGGPIPVDLAKELAEDAFLKVVVHDGKTIQIVSHHGRRYTAELKTALDLGPVPEFSGRACVDCGRRFGLQYDHLDPIAHTGPTSMDNIVDRCWPCHADKTERDRKAGLLGKRAKARGPGHPPRRDGPTRTRVGPTERAAPARDGTGPPESGSPGDGSP